MTSGEMAHEVGSPLSGQFNMQACTSYLRMMDSDLNFPGDPVKCLCRSVSKDTSKSILSRCFEALAKD